MSNFVIGDKVAIAEQYPEMHYCLREYMLRGKTARILRLSHPGKPKRYLVKFDVADPAHGIYWLQPNVLRQAS